MLSQQVLYDLDIFSRNNGKECLFDKLNYCKTDGGKDALTKLCGLKNVTRDNIIERQSAIKYISEARHEWHFPITKSELFYAQQYMASSYAFINKKGSLYRNLLSFNKLFINKGQYYFVLSGTKQVLHIISQVSKLYHSAYHSSLPVLLKEYFQAIDRSLRELNISEKTINIFNNGEPSPIMLFEIDETVRGKKKEALNCLLNNYYELEALFSLAIAHTALLLTFPGFTSGEKGFSITGLKHPLLPHCTGNGISLDESRNTLIITGPNMAGKSTFMKSIGLAFFMANLGIGISASGAEMPVIDTIITSMNTEDDIGKGYSYFFNEVQNVKSIAAALKDNNKVLVIADELFKGTNIKDALECSEIVLEGFLKHASHLFILSTHLYELAEKFEHNGKCAFSYFDGHVEDEKISFTYELKKGISAMRLGTYILKQQQIPKLLSI